MSTPQQSLENEISRRRTFAIISHPDAGKTTLTERILHAGGAIQMAGNVRAKREQRRTRSDWMNIEKDRGISVVTSVMTFEYGGCIFNLLDTPGHEDFSEDTYRTLTAVDSAVMVIDAAKGIEARTLKLFEICRLRDIPIVTFINKMDREAQDPFELLDEVASTLALETVPLTWPVGRAAQFLGTYDIRKQRFNLKEKPPEDDERLTLFKEEIELVNMALQQFDAEGFNAGFLTPVFFGSAIKELGVIDLLDALVDFAPSPRSQTSREREVKANEPAVTALVFKIQANMDPNHRDRIAFARVCSGKLERGMKLKHTRTGKVFALHTPQFFFARDRQMVETAYAGDVVGIPNHGTLRIGDTLTEGEEIQFTGVPYFSPEILRRVSIKDAMKAKKLKQALIELAEEGVVQLFKPHDGSPPIVGVVGVLQLDVLQTRLKHEYGVDISYDGISYSQVRWLQGDKNCIEKFVISNRSAVADDIDNDPVFLATSEFMMNRAIEAHKEVEFHNIKQIGKSDHE
ncbi:Peptide chain release factor RF3 [Commensalibacter sp. Nvir]|uniref:peptide chain release factor 3 n=1 Tax=Commensalibacter sp. Nvir TaxID=3069817 RepID=UPI002D5DBCE8|nr:Peptide chain release factor RF3 [Commensalibacter sp. Nvir]